MWMTKYTSPFGTEQERFGKFFLDRGFLPDTHGNLVLDIGKSKTIFAAHLDTADRSLTRVRRRVKGDLIGTDGKSILGADDRAGLAVLLHLIRNDIPGRYVLFVGEEVGRHGSVLAHTDGLGKGYDRIVCWDRKGEDSIITHQMGEGGCSQAFADALGEHYSAINPGLELTPDPGGVYTDSYSFFKTVPECTNISVGYENAHTIHEYQDARFLAHIAEASVGIPWEEMPVERDPAVSQRQLTIVSSWDDQNWSYYDNNNTARYSRLYNEVEDLEVSAAWGTLRLDDVRQFVYDEPEQTAQALFKVLMEGVKK